MIHGAIGMILALAGFGFGVEKFRVLEQRGSGQYTDRYEYAHAVIGTIVTALMILQPLWMVIMRKPENEAEVRNFNNWPLWRKIGHVGHRVAGFVAIFLAFVCMEMGTHMYEPRKQEYSIAFICVITFTILCVAVIWQFAKRHFQETNAAEGGQENDNRTDTNDKVEEKQGEKVAFPVKVNPQNDEEHGSS